MAASVYKTVLEGDNKKTIQWILIAIVSTVIIYVLYQVYKASKTAGNVAGELAGSAIIEAKTGVSIDRQLVCEQVAADVRDSMYIVPVIGYVSWVIDSDLVNALNRLVTPNEAVLASEFFRQKAGRSLLTIINNSGVFTSKNYIKPTILNALT